MSIKGDMEEVNKVQGKFVPRGTNRERKFIMLEFNRKESFLCSVPQEAIQRFEQRIQEQRIHLHGYMFLSGKNILAEKYFAPYTIENNHRMYSITKSFVSMAIGLLERDGQIKLDDKICDYFPEKLGEATHPWCREMTIRDMLSMRTCHSSTTFNRYGKDDWTESFFRVEPDHVPGTVFSYDTSSSHTLAALVEKLTGMDLLTYLRKKAFDEIGFSKAAYILKDPVGVSQGGSGLMCTLEDIARVAYLCCHYGIIDGKELLPETYMKEAAACQVPTDLQPTIDEQCGYGYFFWKTRQEGFVMYGMGGQLAVCFPELDFCYLTMADTIGNPAGLQILYDSFYDVIYPYLKGKTEGEENVTVGKADGGSRYPRGQSEYLFYDNTIRISEMTFDWEKQKVIFTREGQTYSFLYKWNQWQSQTFPTTDYQCQCRGSWKQGHFILECYITDEEQGHLMLDAAWNNKNSELGKRIGIRVVTTSEPFFQNLKGFASGVLQKI